MRGAEWNPELLPNLPLIPSSPRYVFWRGRDGVETVPTLNTSRIGASATEGRYLVAGGGGGVRRATSFSHRAISTVSRIRFASDSIGW